MQVKDKNGSLNTGIVAIRKPQQKKKNVFRPDVHDIQVFRKFAPSVRSVTTLSFWENTSDPSLMT